MSAPDQKDTTGKTDTGEPAFIGGTRESFERWRAVSHVVGMIRAAGRAHTTDELLNDAAKKSAGTELEPLFRLWSADDAATSGQPDEAVKRYASALAAGDGAVIADDTPLGDPLRQHLANAQETAGDLDGAVRTWEELATRADSPGMGAHARLRIGRLLEAAGDEAQAADAFKAATRIEVDAMDEPTEVTSAHHAEQALLRLRAGRDGAVADPETLADRLRKALSAKDAAGLPGLLAPYGVTVAAPGGDRAPIDPKELLEHLARASKAANIRVDDTLLGEGGKRYLRTSGWNGGRTKGETGEEDDVYLLLTRDLHGWRWSGIASTITADWIFDVLKEEPEPATSDLELTIKAPWPKGICFEAGGFSRYRNRMIELAALAALWPVGPALAAARAIGWSRSDCGFGLGGWYYDQWTTHKGKNHYAIDFARSKYSVPHWLDVKGTPTLSIARGRVRHVVRHAATGDSETANQVWVRHDKWGDLTYTARRYQSAYLHLDGPNKLTVSVGQHVEQGSRLGLMDDTGYSAFSHLHFSLHDMDDDNAAVRPSPMSGVRLGYGDAGRCVCSDNVEYTGPVPPDA